MLLFSYIMPLNQTIFLVIKFVEMQSMKNGELLFFFSLSSSHLNKTVLFGAGTRVVPRQQKGEIH